MMGKRKAAKAIDDKDFTWAELRVMIENAATRGGMSTLNPQFTIEQTCTMFREAIEDKPDDETPEPWTYSGRLGKDVRSHAAMAAINILRDCA